MLIQERKSTLGFACKTKISNLLFNVCIRTWVYQQDCCKRCIGGCLPGSFISAVLKNFSSTPDLDCSVCALTGVLLEMPDWSLTRLHAY